MNDIASPNVTDGNESTLAGVKTVISTTPEPTLRAIGNTKISALAHTYSLAPQDLTKDKILLVAPRVVFNDAPVPALGGIPLIAKIAQGGMGAVYLGYKPMLNVEVAVKVLPLHLVAQQPELVEQFVREARIAARIQSPHLVAVTDVNEENELFYLVMEFVNGKSAGKYLKECKAEGKQGVDERTALEICIAACEGLAAAHAEGVIHRDIKPDNILIPKAKGSEALIFSGSKVADLGLAHGEDSGRSVFSSQVVGTPGYMAPEQWEAAGKAGKPADVFSFGATLYALLAGQSPFSGSMSQMLRATLEATQAPILSVRSDLSPSTAALLDRCLTKDPAKRYADGFALLDALKTCRKKLNGGGASMPASQIHLKDEIVTSDTCGSLSIIFSDRFHSAKALGGSFTGRKGKTSSYLMNEGAWLLLDVGQDLDEVFHLAAWDGQPELYLKQDGPALLCSSKSDGPWKVLGIDARSPQGSEALKWSSTGQTVPSVIVGELMDPRAVGVLEKARPTALRIEGKAPLVALKRISGLRYLSLINNDTLSDFSAAGALTELVGLNIDGAHNLIDSRGIQQLTHLKFLRIASSPTLVALTGMDALLRLTYLNLTMCPKAVIQAVLPSLCNLTHLQLCGCLTIENLAGFGGLNRLTHLNLSSCYALKDIAGVAELSSLAVLNLKRCDGLTDLRPLVWLKNLNSLGVPPTTTDGDLQTLRNGGVLESVRILDLDGCCELRSLQALKGLANLARLSLAGCVNVSAAQLDTIAQSFPNCLIIQ